MSKILLTGGAGYIGSVLTGLLLKKNHSVKAVDALWFSNESSGSYSKDPSYCFIKGDIRDALLMKDLLRDTDLVIHAAAVVGEPAAKKYPVVAREVNYDASLGLINLAKEAGVKGFIFFSTCSNYGLAEGVATESSPLKPLSLYAETKVGVEKYLMREIKGLDWIIARLSTVYGVSPRMRFDLTVNDFAMNAYMNKSLDVFLPYTCRPYIHVNDAAAAIAVFTDNFENLRNDVFNVGFNEENYRKIQIAEAVERQVPGLKINVSSKGEDVRDYRVDFSKFGKYVGIRRSKSVDDGIGEVIGLLEAGGIEDPLDKKHYNTNPEF